MQGKRTDRVAELVRMELGSAILMRLKDPRVGFVTITRVEMSMDLHYAKVFYSVLGSPEEKAKTAEVLDHSKGFLQRDIAKTLKLRYTPHLQFYLDESADHVSEVEGILKQLRPNEPEERSDFEGNQRG